MNSPWTSRAVAACLGLAGVLGLVMTGCGGDKGAADNAVVYTEPGVNVPTAGGGTSAPAPSATTTAAAPAATTSATPAPAAAPTKSEGWGILKGKVVFGGSPPAAEDLVEKGKAPKDETVCAKDAPIKSERLVVDGASKGVRNVLVYIPKPTAVNEAAKAAAATAKVEFDQEKCVFEPHVLGVMNGATIALKSSDSVNHNVNAKLKANSPFNSVLSPGQGLPFVPSAGERTPAEVTCDIHPWMKAYWLVLDSPYFAVTNEKGEFEIKNAPAGTQKVVVWQEAVGKGGFVTAASGDEITIKAGDEPTTKDFTIDAGKILPGK
ncbi:MAG: hypothetical protein P4L84_16135 [Isosphaeraceae bacterium]|nr:hypothetical protein [Isosphaeraceae bacterium]